MAKNGKNKKEKEEKKLKNKSIDDSAEQTEQETSLDDDLEETEEDIDIDEDIENDDEDEELDDEYDEEDEEDDEDDEDVYETDPVKKTMSDKTRYIVISVITVVLLALIVILIVNGKDENNTTLNSNSVAERNTSTEALKEFYKQFDSKELNVIYFASSTCGYCNLEKPIIEQISKDYDMDYYAIDASTLENTEINEMVSALGISGATPTTVIVKEGKVIAKNEGYLDGKPYVEFFAKNGVLDKDATYKQEDRLIPINYEEFKKIAKKDETSLVFLDTSACPDCITVRSLLNKVAEKNNFNINYLSATNLSQDDINNLVTTDLKEMKYSDKTFKDEGQIKIPLLLIIKNNEIKEYVLESTNESDYTKVLEKYDFIK